MTSNFARQRRAWFKEHPYCYFCLDEIVYLQQRAESAEAELKRKDGLLRELLPHLRAYGNHGIASRIQRELGE